MNRPKNKTHQFSIEASEKTCIVIALFKCSVCPPGEEDLQLDHDHLPLLAFCEELNRMKLKRGDYS